MGKSGIGRVCQGILDNLDYNENQYYLVGKKQFLSIYKDAYIIENETDPFSVKGMLSFNSKEINRKCDAIIIPNFIIPFGIKKPIYSIMHDLIFLDVKESVNNKIDYSIKRFLLKRCMKKSKKIFCVSEFTKKRCEFYFGEYADKCYVNYNGISKELMAYKNKREGHQTEKDNSIVYVGNVKRHKGIKTLLAAFSEIDNGLKLKIIGEKEGFITGLDLDENAYHNVEFTGRLSEDELYSAIESAKFLIQPSIYEGFGIPPLEALYLGTKPIISDIEVFKEIYSDLPVSFFKVGDVEDLKNKILTEDCKVVDCRKDIIEKYEFKKSSDFIIDKIKETV